MSNATIQHDAQEWLSTLLQENELNMASWGDDRPAQVAALVDGLAAWLDAAAELFARPHDDTAAAKQAFYDAIESAGGLYLADIDDAPAITTADQLQTMGYPLSGAQRLEHDARKPEILDDTIFAETGAPVVVEHIDGGADDIGQYLCFEASTSSGEPVAQVRIRDAGTYAAQKQAALERLESIGYNVASVR